MDCDEGGTGEARIAISVQTNRHHHELSNEVMSLVLVLCRSAVALILTIPFAFCTIKVHFYLLSVIIFFIF